MRAQGAAAGSEAVVWCRQAYLRRSRVGAVDNLKSRARVAVSDKAVCADGRDDQDDLAVTTCQ